MQKNYTQLLLGVIIGLLAGLLIAKLTFPKASTTNTPVTNAPYNKQQNNRTNNTPTNTNTINDGTIPEKVYAVVQYIKANNKAMDGYVGGRVFTNREKILPQQDATGAGINYQEWDVNPKVQGQNRGTERICTGSDGRSWYTNDHYRTFTEIK
jgi:ribonuclease T1